MAVGAHIGMIGVVSEPILAATYHLHSTALPSTPRKDSKGEGQGKFRRKHKLADLKEFRNLVKCGGGAKIGVELWSWKDTELS